MTVDEKTLGTVNLVIQLLLGITLVAAVYLAKRKQLQRHCRIMRAAVPLLIVTTAGVMLPAMLGYLRYEPPGSLLSVEIWVHHTLGLVVILLWLYINLVAGRVIRMWFSLVFAMRLAMVSWLLALLLGLHLYLLIWR